MEATAKITKSLRKEDVTRSWYVIDAAGKTVGRLSTQVAIMLRGKHKPTFTPHIDNGDFIIIVNADKVQLEGKRPEQKEYFHHTQYPGGDRFKSFKEVMRTKPEFVIEHAVRGMLPKTKLGRQMIKKLKVYAGPEHQHSAQKPVVFELPY